MVKSNTDAPGIIFPNAHDSLVQELVASVPWLPYPLAAVTA